MGTGRKLQVVHVRPEAPGHLENLCWWCCLDVIQQSTHEAHLPLLPATATPDPPVLAEGTQKGSALVPGYLCGQAPHSPEPDLPYWARINAPSRIDAETERGNAQPRVQLPAASLRAIQIPPLWAAFPGHSSPQPLLSFLPQSPIPFVYPQFWHEA